MCKLIYYYIYISDQAQSSGILPGMEGNMPVGYNYIQRQTAGGYIYTHICGVFVITFAYHLSYGDSIEMLSYFFTFVLHICKPDYGSTQKCDTVRLILRVVSFSEVCYSICTAPDSSLCK